MSEHAFEEKESLETAKSGVLNAVVDLFREQPERVFQKEGFIPSQYYSLQWAVLTTPNGISYMADLFVRTNEYNQQIERTLDLKALTLEELSRANNAFYESFMVYVPSGLFRNPTVTYNYIPNTTPVYDTATLMPKSKKMSKKYLDMFEAMISSSTLEHEEDAVRIINSMRATPQPETVDKLVRLAIGKEFPYRED